MNHANKFLLWWSLAGVAGLIIFVRFYDHAFAVASIDLRFSRADAVKSAEQFVQSKGFDLHDFSSAAIFDSEYSDSVYLQRTQGIKKANEYIKNGIPMWFWNVRWFKELDKEGFHVFINPSSGRVEYFSHSLLEDSPGDDLNQEAAKKIALDELSRHGIKVGDYDIKESSTTKQKHRTDHHFVWEKKNFKIADATYRITVEIAGDRICRYSEYLKMPEQFLRDLDKETSSGIVFTTICSTIMFLFTVLAAVVMVLKSHAVNQKIWQIPVILAGAAAALKILAFFNEFSFSWMFYPNTVSKAVFIVMEFNGAVHEALIYASVIFCYAILGIIMCRDDEPVRFPLVMKLINKRLAYSDIRPVCVRGYALAFIFLGYITIFYLLAGRFCGVWTPVNTSYSNILSTPFPFLFPLTIAFIAAVNEEFTYRAFMVNFIDKKIGIRWLALLFPAIVWAFGHSTYSVFPAYVRGIELTIFGVVLGLVFLRYGLETVIIAHFVIDAVLGVYPCYVRIIFILFFRGWWWSALFSRRLQFYMLCVPLKVRFKCSMAGRNSRITSAFNCRSTVCVRAYIVSLVYLSARREKMWSRSASLYAL